jgi:hypothetical protein
MKTITLDAIGCIKNKFEIKVRVKNMIKLKWRTKIAIWLIRLAGKVLMSKIEIEFIKNLKE